MARRAVGLDWLARNTYDRKDKGISTVRIKKNCPEMQLLWKGLTLCTVFVFCSSQKWEDTDTTSKFWSACSMRDTGTINRMLQEDGSLAFVRSADGRGPLFWAYEFGHTEAIELLEKLGADNTAVDVHGKTPLQIGQENAEINAKRNAPVYSDLDEEDDDDYDDYGDL